MAFELYEACHPGTGGQLTKTPHFDLPAASSPTARATGPEHRGVAVPHRQGPQSCRGAVLAPGRAPGPEGQAHQLPGLRRLGQHRRLGRQQLECETGPADVRTDPRAGLDTCADPDARAVPYRSAEAPSGRTGRTGRRQYVAGEHPPCATAAVHVCPAGDHPADDRCTDNDTSAAALPGSAGDTRRGHVHHSIPDC